MAELKEATHHVAGGYDIHIKEVGSGPAVVFIHGAGTLGGHNFSVLFPVWDVLFGTARFGGRFEPTGLRDQLPEAGGRDYGRGFWAQQWLGLKRLVGRG